MSSAAPKSERPVAAGRDANEITGTATIVGERDADRKAFATLQAKFALIGHALHRTCPNDGPATYYAERWGLVRHLPTLDDVQAFLEQIGGRA